MDHKPLFANMILRSGGITEPDSLHDEIADTVVATAQREAATRAIILECADMSVASEAIRQRTGLPSSTP
jgi:Asp/Glu/hydantoin racemase